MWFKKKFYLETGEIVYWFRALALRGPAFSSQHLHGGSQPPMIGSDALFWYADIHADKVPVYRKYRNKKASRALNFFIKLPSDYMYKYLLK